MSEEQAEYTTKTTRSAELADARKRCLIAQARTDMLANQVRALGEAYHETANWLDTVGGGIGALADRVESEEELVRQRRIGTPSAQANQTTVGTVDYLNIGGLV
jgi:hypothetical protein